jgi:ATP-binding cassette subfamily C protein
MIIWCLMIILFLIFGGIILNIRSNSSFPVVKQHSEEDCGAACLATVSKNYGRITTINRLRETIGTGQQGTSLLSLTRGAEALGFNARPVKASPEIIQRIQEAPLPAIIHWRGFHWVVLYGKKNGKFVIADPAIGLRFITAKELSTNWADFVLLLLEPDAERFYSQPDDRENVKGFSRFLKRVQPYQSLLSQVLFLNAILGLLSLASPLLLQVLTDDVLIRGDQKLLSRLALAIGSMYVVSSILQFTQSKLIAYFSQGVQRSLMLQFARQILRLPLTYYESRRSGEVVSRLEDIQEINQLVSQIVVNLPSQFFIAIVSLFLMFNYSPKLTLSAVGLASLMTLSTLIFLPALQQKNRSLLVESSENQGILVETFKGAMTLKITNAAPQFFEEFQGRFTRLTNLTLDTLDIGIINGTFSGLVSKIGSLFLLWLGSSLVIDNELSIGQLLAFNSMNGTFVGFIGALIGFVDEFTRAKTATERLNEVIDATPEEADNSQKPQVRLSGNADITCLNLQFHHSGRMDLLENFTLTIPGGKVTALIGKSGCGKSTLSKLISGLYFSTSGNIRFGDFNQTDIALDCLRRQVILVPQEVHTWSRSIFENFQLGNRFVTLEEVVRACKIVGADEFISQFPDKYQTVLGEFGSNLSGGQRQRLGLARAIVNDPPILILDEPTSALDPISETEVVQSILTYRKGKTTIMISHSPSVIEQADWIIMLENGHVMMEGTPDNFRHQGGHQAKFLIF